MGLITYKKGTMIIEEGTIGTSAYSINSGKVEVSGLVEGQKTVFATLGEKQIFGEMGLIEDKPRSATVTAIEDTELHEITRDGFNDLFHKNPKVLLPIVKALFERLRTATRMAAAKIATTAVNTTNKTGQDVKEEGKLVDDRYIVFSGETEFAKQTLDHPELEIKEFPFNTDFHMYINRHELILIIHYFYRQFR